MFQSGRPALCNVDAHQLPFLWTAHVSVDTEKTPRSEEVLIKVLIKRFHLKTSRVVAAGINENLKGHVDALMVR